MCNPRNESKPAPGSAGTLPSTCPPSAPRGPARRPRSQVILQFGLGCVLLAVVASFTARPVKSQASALPPGKGLDKVKRSCLLCHEADIILEQRLDRGRWEKDVDKMVRWGALVASEDRQEIIDYLSTHFGPVSKRAHAGPSALPAGKGLEKVERACLLCHEADIIIEQRLDRGRWEKDVDKMIRWGALVPPEDRQEIIDYLAIHFGPR